MDVDLEGPRGIKRKAEESGEPESDLPRRIMVSDFS